MYKIIHVFSVHLGFLGVFFAIGTAALYILRLHLSTFTFTLKYLVHLTKYGFTGIVLTSSIFLHCS